ncbi:hypothetical protein ACQ4PT_014029 [Festuca glaucescens]
MATTTHEYSPVQLEQPEAPKQSSSSSSREQHFCALLVLCTLFIPLFAIVYGVFALADQCFNQVPHYSVAIDHVAGLDPAADLGRGTTTLEPEFNLTLRVASWGLWATECAEPRMYLTVSYRGVSLAASATLTEKICARPMKAIDHHLVARGAGVVVPGSLLDSLAMDMRSGVPEFDIELCGPGPEKMKLPCGQKAGRGRRGFGNGVQGRLLLAKAAQGT